MHTRPRIVGWLLILFMGLCLPLKIGLAQSFTASDLIAAVNSLRVAQGLSPYQIDPELMSYAQQHSEYQASINLSTHTHSDGSSAISHGIQENVAAGSVNFLTVEAIVYQIWADAVHWKTMVGYQSGEVGAGVATIDNDVYVTLNVRPGEAVAYAAQPQSSVAVETQKPLFTSTPAADGSISHVVGYGQSLWSIAIAYGVRINSIRDLNKLPPDSNTIFVGQRLLIVPAGSITPAGLTGPVSTATITATRTPQPPTATLRPTSTPIPSITPTETVKPFLNITFKLSNRSLGIALILVASLGFILVLIFGFLR